MKTNRRPPGYLWIIQLAEVLNSRTARLVKQWDPFDKERLGDQLSRAVDSIGLNISEGYVRIHDKERLHFFAIADGSLEEALYAVRRARDRKLLSTLDASILSGLLINLSKALKAFVDSVRS